MVYFIRENPLVLWTVLHTTAGRTSGARGPLHAMEPHPPFLPARTNSEQLGNLAGQLPHGIAHSLTLTCSTMNSSALSSWLWRAYMDELAATREGSSKRWNMGPMGMLPETARFLPLF